MRDPILLILILHLIHFLQQICWIPVGSGWIPDQLTSWSVMLRHTLFFGVLVRNTRAQLCSPRPLPIDRKSTKPPPRIP
ncbi:hypothetical protein F4804DRAFT_102885 [Jackrogersella minutella]|nr:hypothetical protein F4804DRAFT_102885 [Jackrogersella minutella]